MKKIISVIMALTLVCTALTACGSAASEQEQPAAESTQQSEQAEDGGSYVLRKVRWGMTRDEVMASEGDDGSGQQRLTELHYSNVRMYDVDFILDYYFKSQKLVNASYRATISSPELASELGQNLFDGLTEKYGSYESHEETSIDTYIWYSDDTEIKLSKSKSDDGMTFYMIDYNPSDKKSKNDNGNL